MTTKKVKSKHTISKNTLSNDKNQTSQLLTEIRSQLDSLWYDSEFQKWVNEQKIQIEDLIVVNNSYILRNSSSTKKNQKYLAFKLVNQDLSEYEIYVIDWDKILKADFKRISRKSKDYPELISLNEEIKVEFKSIGKLIFTLIGKKIKDEPCEEPINHEQIKLIIWNSDKSDLVHIKAGKIIINDPYDIDLWDQIRIKLNEINLDLSDDELNKKIEKALQNIKREATTIIEIPKRGEKITANFLSDIINFLDNELEEYFIILNKESKEINDLLRISYNFLDDGLALYRLICSICDLKPLILWGTIFEHFSHNQSLLNIPNLIPGKKVDLKQYENMIRQARNNKFHRMINFKRSLQINLPDDAIKNPQLKIFTEFKSKKSNKFTYQDQELVELLMGFTRTKELTLTEKFWEKNYDVMHSTLAIFKKTENLLKIILHEQP